MPSLRCGPLPTLRTGGGKPCGAHRSGRAHLHRERALALLTVVSSMSPGRCARQPAPAPRYYAFCMPILLPQNIPTAIVCATRTPILFGGKPIVIAEFLAFLNIAL